MRKDPIISFKIAVFLAVIIAISFAVISLLLENDPTLRMIFGDLTSPLIEIIVITSLSYAAYRSQGRMQIAWMLMALAVLSYTIGDVIWAVLELGFNQNPFPSVADIFYLLFYPLFALGIYFIPRDQFSRLEELKIILEMGIVILTVGLIFWIFLIEPNLSNQEDFFPSIISITYIVGDFVLLFALLRLLYSRFKEEYYGPLILLGLGMIVTIVSDCIYSYQNLLGTYISGGLLDAGWMIGLLLFGLSAFLHASNEKYDIYPYFKSLPLARSNLTSYLPLIWALIAFILLIQVDQILYDPNINLMEIIVGIIIFMVLIRQLLTEKALSLSEENYRELVDNSLVGIYKTNLNGDIIFANESLARIFKSESVEELKSQKIKDFYKNPSERKEIIQQLKKEGKMEQYELEMVSSTGETLNMLLSANLTGNIISGMLMDITQRKNTEKALQNNEEKYRTLFEANPNHTILVSSDGVILDANSSAARFSGLSTGELIGKNFSDLGIFSEDNRSFAREKFSRALKGETLKPFQYRLINKNGEYSWIETQLVPIKKDGKINSILIIDTDITDRRNATEKLKSSLNEKKILIKEIHHRVKNNMQIITSLLSLQIQHLDDEEIVAATVLKESQNRVRSMAMIHEKLYLSKDFTHIRFEDYIKRLLSDLLYSYDTNMGRVKLVVDVEDVNLNMETAVPCGLIISELISNSLKYAFPEEKNGKIKVSLKQVPENLKFILTVADDGVGLPEDLDFKNTRTLGLELVNNLTKQIDGEIKLDRSQGTKFEIRFNELTYNKRI